MLHYPDMSSLAVADIPGLIKGASDNRGLGHRFLRHVERSQALAFVLDLSSGVQPDTGPSALEQFQLLQVWFVERLLAWMSRGWEVGLMERENWGLSFMMRAALLKF